MSNNLFRAFNLSCSTCAPLLIGYADRQLDSGRRAKVEAHLSACRSCRAQLVSIREIADALRATHAGATLSNTDLWQTLEAKILVTPQRQPGWLAARAAGTIGIRNPLLGDSGWGQALPIGATVFAAGVLVFVVVDSTRHLPDSRPGASLAAIQPQDAEKVGYAKPDVTKLRVAAVSGTSTKLAEGSAAETNEAPEYAKHVQIAFRSVSPSVQHRAATRTRRSGTLQHIPSDAGIAAVEEARRSADPGDQYDGANSAAAYRHQVSTTPESESPRDNQIATVTKQAEANVDRAITLAAPVRFGAFEAAVALRNRRSSSVVASVSSSRGSYASEDDSDTKVSFADASASIQRQQKLFSY